MTERFSPDWSGTPGPMNPTSKRRLLGLALGLVLAGCRAEPGAAEPPPRPVAWTEARPADDAARRSLAAVIRAAERTTLSFEVSGRIESVAVDIGDRFERGDVLAQLDDRTFRLRLQQKKAELSQARASAAEAAAQLKRIRAVLAERATTEAEFDRAQAAATTSQSQVELLEASVELARENLGDTRLVAPYDGEVSRRMIEPSQLARAGEPAFEVQDDREGLEVHVAVPETLIDRLEIGSVHRVTLPARPDAVFEAVLNNVAADSSGPNLFPATLRIRGDRTDLRSGLTAEVDFAVRDADPDGTNRVVVPVSSLLARAEDETSVFVIRDDDTVHERTVIIDDLSGSSAILSSGVSAGEAVVSKGVTYIRDGQSVSRMGEGVARYSE